MNEKDFYSSPDAKTELTSQRNLDSDEEKLLEAEETGPNMLSSIIENQVEFYNPIKAVKVNRKPKNRIKLFADCVENIDVDKKFISKPQVKPIITRRIIELELNPMSSTDRIKFAAIDPSFILEKTETKYWTDRKKSKIIKYKSKTGNPYQFVESDNEFSKTRKKNCWSEKRISRTFKQ